MAYAAALLSLVLGQPPSEGTIVTAQLCGRYSLALVAEHVGRPLPDAALEQLSTDRAPFSVAELEEAARAAGCDAVTLHWSDVTRADLHCPAILHVRSSDRSTEPDHFVACFGQTGEYVCLADYPGNPVLVRMDHLAKYWSGTALYLDQPGGDHIRRIRSHAAPTRTQMLAVATLVVGSVAVLACWGCRRGRYARSQRGEVLE